jgi:spermidine/putrescine transport system permease protein
VIATASTAARTLTSRLHAGRRRLQDSFDHFGLGLTLLFVVPFFLVPFGLMVLYSFATQDYLTAQIKFGWTLSGWKALSDPIVYRTFIRSITLSTVATISCALVGYPLAYFVARRAGRFRNIALLLIIIPFWVSFIIRTYAWVTLLGDAGPINRFLERIGLIHAPLPLLYHSPGIAIGILYGYLPLMVFPIYVSLERIDARVLESARDLGASSWSTFRRVTFPQALPGLVAGCTLVWIPALGEYVIPEILGGGKTYMIGNVIAQRFTEAFQWPVGAALSVALVLFALVVLGISYKLLGRERLGQTVNS